MPRLSSLTSQALAGLKGRSFAIVQTVLEDLLYDPVNNPNGSLFLDNGWSGTFGNGNTSGVTYGSGQYMEKTFTVTSAKSLTIETQIDSVFTNRDLRLRVINTSTGSDFDSVVLSWSPSGINSFVNTLTLGTFTGDVTVRYQFESTYIGYHGGIKITENAIVYS